MILCICTQLICISAPEMGINGTKVMHVDRMLILSGNERRPTVTELHKPNKSINNYC